MMDSKMLGEGTIALLVAVNGIVAHFGGKKRDRRHTAALDGRFATLDLSLEQRFNGMTREVGEVRAEVREVKSYCIGPDGRNGLRGDIQRLRQETSEQWDSLHRRNNALASSLSDAGLERAKLGERMATVEKCVDGLEERERARGETDRQELERRVGAMDRRIHP